MATTEVTEHVAVPAPEVFELIARPDRHPLWQKDLTSDGIVSGDGGVGSQGREVRHVMGRSVITEYEITKHAAPRSWGFRTTSGPISMEGAFTCVPTEGGTEVRARIRFSGWSGEAMARFATRQFRQHLRELKDLAERGGPIADDTVHETQGNGADDAFRKG
ncbi:SRPBCC family protein [Streptomyces oceani]|uniref:Polyketide cyclase n=1 Tax=Streptomyces oceani TaxID=1075402 RepID=A0A1E7KPI4_9ACTN|nr:SRPBCC family protein [Streptomyces oceani]OEV05763.1 hypothetical protein AN216_02125 [Streptomyces oceani]